MDSWKSYIIAFALTALFAFSLISYGALIQSNNNVPNGIINDSRISNFKINITNDLNNFGSASNNYQNQTGNEQGTQQNPAGALSLVTIFHTFSTFGGFITGFASNLIGSLSILGLDTMTKSILIGILGMIAILLFWKLYKWGS